MTEQQTPYQRMLDWCSQQHIARVQAGQQPPTLDPCSAWVREAGRRFVMGEPPLAAPLTVIEGTRTITHQPLGKPGERERGTITNEAFKNTDWLGDNVGQVIDLMDASLGTIPADDYRIVE